jgi:hypothetical protein
MMAVIDHGKWQSYQPATLPPGVPAGAIFVRRESDGVDWYDYVNNGANFGAGTVKFTALWSEGYASYMVKVAVYDETMLFPPNQLVREITDYAGSDPHADLANKLYDPATDAFSDRPVFEMPPALDVKALLDRIATLEAKLGDR